MRTGTKVLFGFIIVLTLFSLWVVWPQNPTNYLPNILPWPKSEGIHIRIGNFSFDRQGAKLGLDLQGGVNLLLEADLSKVEPGRGREAMEGLRQIIDRRVNALGTGEPVLQIQGENRLSVQLAGIRDVAEAKRLIGQTAQLDFRELKPNAEGQQEWVVATAKGSDGKEKPLTGQYFKPNAAVVADPQTGLPEVRFEFNDEGALLFEQITTRLLFQPLGIFLDNELISAPRVQAVLRNSGVITGMSLAEAQLLAIQLNSGALPVPVSIIKEQTVDATLGSDSIKKSIVAGEIGFAVVFLFMLLHYRLPGLLAGMALVIYALVTLAIFKLIPVTLTLAGIAAFILSVGMAVDANILIFERMREELRWGRTLGAAIEAGFDRAWTSIRDSNISTLITCLILMWYGNSSGTSLIIGFAVTLAIGVLVSMFTAITVTRTFLRMLLTTGLQAHLWLFGVVIEPPSEGERILRPISS